MIKTYLKKDLIKRLQIESTGMQEVKTLFTHN